MMEDPESGHQENCRSISSGDPNLKEKEGSPLRTRLRRRMTAEIDTKRADVILVGCFFCAGLVDSVAYNVYNCFVSLQTGNTIFVALGVSREREKAPTFQFMKSLIAIIAYCLGAVFFGTFHRKLTPLKRWVVVSSFTFQAALIMASASLVSADVVSNTHADSAKMEKHAQKVTAGGFPWLDLLPIAFLSFQSAGQVVASRVLNYKAMPTNLLTVIYTDLILDAHQLRAGLLADPQRNRRLASVVALFSGALTGGFLARSWVHLAGALWLAAFVKSSMVVSWFLWKPQIVIEAEDTTANDDGRSANV